MLRLISVALIACICLSRAVHATPTVVEHSPNVNAFNEGASTQRFPLVPREDEAVQLFFRVSFQFTYDRVAVYFTTDGSEPSGSFGTGGGTTQVLSNTGPDVVFRTNQNDGGTRDWWRATLPASTRQYAASIKYKISAWRPFDGPEVFVNGGASFTYQVKLAWPGQGSNFVGAESVGYPPVHFWKEEAVVGNGWINAMLDQNGSFYDVHYPGAGGVFGIGTRNEGYAGGLDTFPPGTPGRGQMHINQAMPGIRIDGVTRWLSNQNGTDFTDVAQSYVADTNVVRTFGRLVAGGNNIAVEQFDFSPRSVAFALDGSGNPLRGVLVKRMLLTNNGPVAKTVNVYFYGDFALNGGDGFDGMFWDPIRGAMCAFDNAGGTANSRGEYNITTFPDVSKNVSVYLAAAMKSPATVGGVGGQLAVDSWRDSSNDNGQGWIGQKITIAPGATREVDFCVVGGFDSFALATGTYNVQMAPVLDWFSAGSAAAMHATTEQSWRDWLAEGVTVDTPDNAYDDLFKRGLLATALHVDEKGGGIIAGFHNGAYPYVWPRDAVYAAICLDRTGHFVEAENVYRFLREVCYRDVEPGTGRLGFWKQKYTTDGYTVWGAPQIDETANVPWGVKYHYDITGSVPFLNQNYAMSFDAGSAMVNDSQDSRLRYEEAFNLVYSNNVWEDSYDTFIYSNAAVVRGLLDLGSMATTLGYGADAALWNGKATQVQAGLEARLDWNGENTDISQLGITYPFYVVGATHPRANLVVDRINGTAVDRFGNNHPLMNFPGAPNGWAGLLNRYWGDGYWNGGPWFLNTLWYGLYYGERGNYTPGTADIDNMKLRIDLCIAQNGPMGFGAEQMAPDNSLLFVGQDDFKLQTAWPNAWESMSTYADAVMKFLDFTPEAAANRMTFAPKLPAAWGTMTFRNVKMANHALSLTVSTAGPATRTSMVKHTAETVNVRLVSRVNPGISICLVTVNGVSIPFSHDSIVGKAAIDFAFAGPAGIEAIVAVVVTPRIDFNGDGVVSPDDLDEYITTYFSEAPDNAPADFNADGLVSPDDLDEFITAYFEGSGCG